LGVAKAMLGQKERRPPQGWAAAVQEFN